MAQSIYRQASLIMKPYGSKESLLPSIKPTDGSGDFTFSRGADTATRVNASGLIEKETSNQILQSNSFDTTWVKSGGAVTGGQSGYDGSNDAFSFISNTSNGGHRVIQSISATGVNTISIYAKANGYNYLAIYEPNNGGKFFDLQNGVVGNTMAGSAPTFASIQSVGNGWYRCSIVCDTTITSVEYWLSADGTNHIFTGNGTSGVFIQDAQLNQGLVAQDYLETTTSAVYGGVTDNLPRLDYSGGASCPSLLLEPQRTNVFPSSEVETSNWLIGGGGTTTIEVNNETSPEGVQNAAKVTTTAADGFIYDVVPESIGTTYTHSFYVKNIDSQRTRFWISTGSSEGTINWDGTTISSVTGGTDRGYESVGNGWYRVWATGIATGTSFITRFYIDNLSGVGGSLYLYGFQHEAGSYPTSYIPTYGSGSQTRVRENNYKSSISDLIGQTEGTIFAEVDISHLDGVSARDLFFLSNTDNISDDWVGVGFSGIGSNTLRGRVVEGGSLKFDQYGTISSTGTYKIALSYKSGDGAFYVNGVNFGTNYANTNFSITLDRIFNTAVGFTAQFGDGVKQMLVFKTRLTNAELASLTTL